MHARLGFFENFLGADTILIDGDREALSALATQLKELDNPAAELLRIHALPYMEVRGRVELTAFPVDRELGVRRRHADWLCFTWRHSEEGWLEAAEKIEAVALGRGGHAWLECIGVEDAVVMVSQGEYGSEWWDRMPRA